MKALKRFFLSRKTILWLITFILIAVIVAYFIPQRFSTTMTEMARWRSKYSFIMPLVDRLGLDHIYSTLWFSALLFMFLISISLSTYEQIRAALKKTFGLSGNQDAKKISLNNSLEQCTHTIKKLGYMKIAHNEKTIKFIKYPWGYLGNVLFHLGMVIVIVSSIFIVLTQRRGQINLVVGEIFPAGSPLTGEEKGLLAESLILPDAVRLDEITYEFWETDEQKHLSSVISFISPGGGIERHELAINKTASYRGIKIYQGRTFGNTFLVTLSEGKGKEFGIRLDMEYPVKRDRPSYNNFEYDMIPYLLKAKYFADAEKKSMDSSNPLLVIRLLKGGDVIGEVSLKLGESGNLGPYKAKLVGVMRWGGIILLDISGMPGIFMGFFIIILGLGLTYFMPAREIYLIKEDMGYSLRWKAARFEDFYKEEFERIGQNLKVKIHNE
ncbi:MAG: cytochrome c biogenesis protein ResB [Nitrospirota bacterium]